MSDWPGSSARWPATGTYLDSLLTSLAAGGEREALVGGGTRLTYAAAYGAVLRTARALASRGLGPGDGVALFTGNRPEAVVAQLATHLIGGRLVQVIPEPGPGELRAFVNQADVAALVFDPALGPRARELAGQVRVGEILSLGPAGTGTDLLDLAGREPAEPPAVRIGQRDIVTVMYTGGTTGRSKLVTHGHLYYDVCVLAARRRRAAAGPAAERLLICTLATHSSGHVSIVTGLMAGVTLVLNDDFDAGATLEVIGREAITGIALNPPALYELLDHPGCPRRGRSTLARISYGGGPAAPARLREAMEVFGPVLNQSYGLTEAPFITALGPAEHGQARPETLRSCGRPLPTMEVEVRREDGAVAAPGEVGEIHARGLMVMTGYWGDPARTAEALPGGWLRTGDLGYADSGGYLYLVDRSKDVIVTGTGSDNVYSRLLDDFLVTLGGVRQAAAVGVPDDRWGEAVHLFVVPEPGAAPALPDLARQVVAELGPHYEPQGITLVPRLPWTPLGKIDKKALRAGYAAALPA